MLDVADDGLTAVVDRDVLHFDGLLAFEPVLLQRLDLRRKGAC
jgi:hypothetical protein